MGKLDGKVALITGAARGQGRSHAIRLAEEGAGIIAVDICRQVDAAPYPLATKEDLVATAEAVEALGQPITAHEADVRDPEALAAAYRAGVQAVGPVDIIVSNAGIAPYNDVEALTAWQDTIDINLTGTLNTVETVLPDLIARGKGGSIVLTSSTAGVRGVSGTTRGGLAYAASKHGVIGLMRCYANNLAPHSIRVNAVLPTGVRTPMGLAASIGNWFATQPNLGDMSNALPVDLVEPEDVASAVLWLVSDDARYVTGMQMRVDAGFLNKR
ncbi:3-ketoacyl-ACP reductase [Mycobacterium sp. E2327]|uniref:mycofactocin-coupled SDR family oxidoreductase n=1 Tax=Mycobacterium sp. E2327 TaxID=1834132 RepID=UPI0007FDD9B8|nr:mycofactocin-coupled SDR family oxidoreductase [Mycobacterium sp. E2327]OBI15769.1 3-ketoacyl-ACP reductase [Mycobacterium sp. E2327]